MTPTPPKVIPNGRYSTLEAAALLGITRTMLWRMTSLRQIKCGYRRSSGRRFYTGREIMMAWEAKL